MRRMDTVSQVRRIDTRHRLAHLFYHAKQMANDVLLDDLNADGAVEDIDRMIAELRACRRNLGGKP